MSITQAVSVGSSLPELAECSDASKDDDSEGDSQQRGSEYDDEDMEDLIGDFLTSFVTSPDFERGFKWSGKTQSHIHLENVNHGLRRRLAATLLSVERARSAGGLLNSGYVLDRALDRINELGQQADDLCAECAAAKRGTADLTRRTERTQHCVSMLHSWIEWLKAPNVPGADGKHSSLPPMAPDEAAGGMSSRSGDVAPGAPARMSARQALRTSVLEAACAKAEAADRAMQELLEEEEAAAKQKQEADRKREHKRQKRRGRKKRTSPTRPAAAPGSDGDSSDTAAQAPAYADGTEETSLPADEVALTDAHGAKVRAKRIAIGFGMPGVKPQEDTNIVSSSAFEALESLDDDVDASLLVPGGRASRGGQRGAGRAGGAQQPAPPPRPRHSGAGAATPTDRSFEGFTPVSAPRATAPAAQPQHGDAPPPAPPPAIDPPATLAFIMRLQQKGLWEHNRFTNAMNPVTRSHDPALRQQYALLSKPEQQALWRMIPREQLPKRLAQRGGAAVPPPRPPDTPPPAGCTPLGSRPGAHVVAPPAASAGRSLPGRGRGGRHAAPGRGRGALPVPAPMPPPPPPPPRSPPQAAGAMVNGSEQAGSERGDGAMCVVCMERAQDALLMPCRHTVLCVMCAIQVREFSNECPYCRSNIDEILHVQ